MVTFEHLMPLTEALQSVLAELCKTVLCLPVGLLALRMSLAIELVGVANDFLLECLRQEVLMGKGKVLLNYLLAGEPRSGVTFTHSCVTGVSFGSQHFGSATSMADIWLRAEAFDAGRVALADADVVQHCRLDNKLTVHLQLRMGITNAHSTLHDKRAMRYEYPPKFVVFGVVFVYD